MPAMRFARPLCPLYLLIGLLLPAAHATATPRPGAPVDSSATVPPPAAPTPAALQFGALVQTTWHAAQESLSAAEGFQVARARLEAEGQIGASVAYEVDADFVDEAPLQDARVAYRIHPTLTLGAGRFKVPFSHGELVSSAATDFVQRPRVADRLSIGRRTGVDASYRLADGRVHLQGGVFSGTAADDALAAATTEEWLYAARLAWAVSANTLQSTVGLNAVHIQHADADRVRYGADLRLRRGSSFLTAEAIAAPDAPPLRPKHGAYLTLGHGLTAAHLVRAQWDYLAPPAAPAADGPPPARSLLGIGYTFDPASPLRIEIDYHVPVARAALHRGTMHVNLQLSL